MKLEIYALAQRMKVAKEEEETSHSKESGFRRLWDMPELIPKWIFIHTVVMKWLNAK